MITVREFLSKKGIQYRVSGNEAIANCPFCDDAKHKFSVNVETGVFRCFRENTCGVRGSFYDLQKRLGSEPERLTGSVSNYIHKEKSYRKPSVSVQPPTDPVIKYLQEERKFTKDTITYFKLGAVNGAVMLPFYKDGEIVNVKYRKIDKKEMWQEKNAEQSLFNRDNIAGEEIIITEGEYDCMALHQYGLKNVASVPSGASNFDWVDDEWDFLESFTTVIFCFDNDMAGQTKERELVVKLGSWRCMSMRLPKKDANDCLMSGIPQHVIQQCYDNRTDYAPAILTKPSDYAEDIKEILRNKSNLYGIKTAWEKLTMFLGGWREEELTVWTGRSGAGKSTILNQVAIHLAGEGVRTCIASLEMPPKRYLRWAITQFLGNIHPSDTAVDSALAFMDGKIYVINTHEETGEDVLMDVFEYAVRRYNCKHLVIDSLVRVVLKGKEELEAQKAFVSRLVSFAKKFKCHIHLVAHPRKGMKDSDMPDKSDVKGDSAITDLAYNVISLWRGVAKPEENNPGGDILLSVLKNREMGETGRIRMYFNSATRRYSDKPLG